MSRFHLGWFTNFSNPPWNGQWSSTEGDRWPNGEAHLEFTKALERAKFDYVMLEDSSMVSDGYRGTSEADLKHGLYAPKHDPVMLAPILATETDHIGIIATCSTTFYPPWLLARRFNSLDHVSGGRIGWNMVTSSEDRAAQNFGLDALPEHDLRYDVATEFVDVVHGLWGSWEPDALVMDENDDVYVDHTKVHTLDHDDRFFKVRGPMNNVASPQIRPVLCQAGGSPKGRDFAARYADTLLTAASGTESMKAFRDDIRRRMEGFGRDPDTLKVMFITQPVLGETTTEALGRRERMAENEDGRIESALAHLSALTEIDMSQWGLDEDFGTLTTNGHTTTLGDFVRYGNTPREAALGWSMKNVHFVGTPDDVAEQMGETMDAVGGDGFLITGSINRRFVDEITDGLIPALQRRGLTRTEYEGTTLREILNEF